MAFLDLTNELTGTLPGLSPLLAKKYINRALEQVYGERTWSFLLTDGLVNCPLMVTAGTVDITQYSATVILDATASAALLAQTQASGVPGMLQLQIRFGSGSNLGGVYSIIAFDNSNPALIELTLDRVVQETTDAASTYQCYRCLITPPITDFLRWETLVDFANAITLSGNRITLSSAWFDRMDPQRTSAGLSYYLGSWGGNRTGNPVTGATVPNATVDAGTPIYELWPHPTSGQVFYVRFRRKGAQLVNPTDVQEQGISDAIILNRAMGWWAYPFAMANVGSFPTFKGANWPTLIAAAKAAYKEELTEAKRNDDASQLQSVWNRGHGLRTPYSTTPGWPVDASYIATHLLNF